MLKQEKIEDFWQEFIQLLPDDLRIYKQDVEKNLKAALASAFARMDLVTREEFDIQNELLNNTRLLIDELEQKVKQLEGNTETE